MDNMRYDSTGNLFIRFPQLQPNRNYVVAISTIPVFEQIDSVLIALHNKNTNAAQIRLAQLSSATQKTLRLGDPARCNQCEPIPFQIDGNIADFLNFYDSVNIDKYLTIIDTNTVLLSRQRNAHIRMRDVDSAHLYNINESLISTFIAYAMECLTCKDTVWQFNWFTKNNINIPLLLTNLDKLKDSLVSKGYTTVDSLYFYMAIDTSIQKRAGNLLYSFNSISNLRQLVDYFIYKYHLNPSAVTSFRQSLARAGEVFLYNYTALITQYKTFSKLLSDSADARKSITMAIANYKGFTQPFTSLNSNTYSFDFETRSGFVLKADFGFLYYGNLTKRSPLEGLSPYIGFHVNFRPLNTNVKFYKINHKGVQGHLSFVSGVLLASLKETGKRDGLIGDASVFTGLGWAFSHAVRLTAGAVFYRKSDSNPLIDHKTTAATAFAGMSFDLRLKEAYTSLKKIFEP